MPLDRIKPAFDRLEDGGRSAPLGEALGLLGEALFGVPGAVAVAGAAITAAGGPVLDIAGRIVAGDRQEAVADPVLAALGLTLVRTPPLDGPLPELLGPAVLMLRVGLLGRILDIAHAHLKGRRSFGRKTLSHQLVKVGFAEAHAAMLLTADTAEIRRATGETAGLAEDHAGLTEATLKAEKLMGGHGYLIGGTHPIGYLSMLLHAIYGPRP